MTSLLSLALAVVRDLIHVLFRSRSEVVAENFFLRRQLVLYQERKVRNHAAVIVACDFFTSSSPSRSVPDASSTAT